MACLDENKLAEFLQGLLSSEAAAEVEAHIDGCAECQAWLKLMAAVPEARGSDQQRILYDTEYVRAAGGSNRSIDATVVKQPSTVQPGEVIAGKYRVERVLATGGMGMVVSAMHLALKQRVALKFMLPAALENAEAVGRFTREARAAARLRSEHVGRVIDLDALEHGAPFIVMELLEGEDLAALLEREGRLPLGDAVEYLLQAMEAVAEAHAAGIVHRDLKPPNLFLTWLPDGSPCIKVLDFGISKVEDRMSADNLATTDSKAFMGSPRYMAPEQLMSAHDVDARADIWALGCILFQLVSGKVPFDGGTLPQLVANVLQTTPSSLAGLGVEAAPGLEAVLRGCLERDREQRVASLAQLAEQLEPFAPPRALPSIARICASLGVARTPAFAPAPAPEPVVSLRPRSRTGLWLSGLAAVAVAGLAITTLSRPTPAPAPVPVPAPAPAPVPVPVPVSVSVSVPVPVPVPVPSPRPVAAIPPKHPPPPSKNRTIAHPRPLQAVPSKTTYSATANK